MLDKINIFKQDKNKKNWKPYHEELFSNLTADNIDDSIKPYIELLKTSDFWKIISKLRKKIFVLNKEEYLNKSFKKFVDYLLIDGKYKDFFKQSMERYKICDNEDAKNIYDEIYKTTFDELEKQLARVKDWKNVSLFNMEQIIKLLRWDAFIFKLENSKWYARIEKDYLYGKDAKKIHKDNKDGLWNKPVYGFRMHIWEWMSVYGSFNSILDKMWKFVKNVDVGTELYVWMDSWLLDTDFLRYRLSKRWRTDKDIEAFMEKYKCLWDIELSEISEKSRYKKTHDRIKAHLKWKEKEIVDLYEQEWNRLKSWRCLIKLGG